MSFHEGDLQSGITAAIQQQKAVLCFVHEESDRSAEWETALQQEELKQRIDLQAVALRIRAGTPEAAFLTPICPINSTPAVVVIKNAALQANIQGEAETPTSLTEKLIQLFGGSSSSQTAASNTTTPGQTSTDDPGQPADSTTSASSGVGYIDLPSSAGQPRLPNNAYDALREFTDGLKEQGLTPDKILEAQLSVLSRLPIFKDEIHRLRSRAPNDPVELSQSARDRLMLRLPAAAIKAQMKVQSSSSPPDTSTSTSTSTPPPPAPPASGRVYPPRPPQTAQPPSNPSPNPPPAEPPQLSPAQFQQQSEYRQMQRDRETKAREERERIKQQIKADKEERRRRDQVQKQNDAAAAAASTSSSAVPTKPATNPNELRVQVRTFDGSLLRSIFTPTSTIAADLRPWIDGEVSPNVPYDFKLILTPMPNRKIEAAEEEMGLRDLGVRGSCTFVIAPVRGYVESYAGGGSGGLVGSVVSGGYNLVAGTVGGLLGGVGSLLGYGAGGGQQGGAGTEAQGQGRGQQVGPGGEGAAQQQRSMRVRTLADQRAEEQRGNQFYNGNALNFQPNKDDDRKKD